MHAEFTLRQIDILSGHTGTYPTRLEARPERLLKHDGSRMSIFLKIHRHDDAKRQPRKTGNLTVHKRTQGVGVSSGSPNPLSSTPGM